MDFTQMITLLETIVSFGDFFSGSGDILSGSGDLLTGSGAAASGSAELTEALGQEFAQKLIGGSLAGS